MKEEQLEFDFIKNVGPVGRRMLVLLAKDWENAWNEALKEQVQRYTRELNFPLTKPQSCVK
jgi:hypothetical protein